MNVLVMLAPPEVVVRGALTTGGGVGLAYLGRPTGVAVTDFGGGAGKGALVDQVLKGGEGGLVVGRIWLGCGGGGLG